MKIAITGHRPNKLGNDYDLTSPLIKKIGNRLIEIITHYKIPSFMISGMAQGIDTLWAEIAINAGIPLIAAVPDASQADRWPKKAQTRYYRILDKATQVVNVSKKVNFKIEHLQLRNEWMVDNCDLLIAVWDGTPGGTANCIKYAKSKLREDQIIRINPNDYRIRINPNDYR